MTLTQRILVTILALGAITLSALTFKTEADYQHQLANQVMIAYHVGCLEGNLAISRNVDPAIYGFHCHNVYLSRDKAKLKDLVEKLEANLLEQ